MQRQLVLTAAPIRFLWLDISRCAEQATSANACTDDEVETAVFSTLVHFGAHHSGGKSGVTSVSAKAVRSKAMKFC